MYFAYQTHSDALAPLRAFSRTAVANLLGTRWPSGGQAPHRIWAAALETFCLTEVTHERPPWGLHSVHLAGENVAVVEEAADVTPFATLRRFAKPGVAAQQKVLLVAPMSGRFATLLRDTVRTMLPDHDVHITDWHNARDVPLAEGRFGLDEYTEHIVRFLRKMGPGSHLVAICQPCVAALAAVALMSEDDDPAVPASLTLMAGPIDCRISPTAVNRLAMSKPIEWFEKNLISVVPWQHGGAGRRVYPGFVQLSAFMSMNRQRHLDAFRDYFLGLIGEDDEKTAATRIFYEEYMAVADLAAEFYLETVKLVFQDHALPRGKLLWRGRKVDPGAIRRTALVTVEGEKDDICAIGQTLAAQDLCTKLRPYMRTHYVQPGVGHYGVFSGRRWQKFIYPMVRGVIQVSN